MKRTETKLYIPSPSALDILENLRKNATGMKYMPLRKSVGISDTYFSKQLDLLKDHGAVEHDALREPYIITETGMRMLATHRGLHFTQEDFEQVRLFRDLPRLLKELHRLHSKIYRLIMEKEPSRIYSLTVFENPGARFGVRVQELTDEEVDHLPFSKRLRV